MFISSFLSSSVFVNELIKWLSTGFVRQNAPLCKHVLEIWFPAQSAVCLKAAPLRKGLKRLISFLAPFFLFFFFFFLSLALSTPPAPMCSSLKPPGRRRKKTLAASEIGLFHNYLLARLHSTVKLNRE